MSEYLNLNIERKYSRYPGGLKHYAKDGIIESILFDIDIIIYKIARLLKGESNEMVQQHRGEEEKTQEEIL